MKQLEFLVQDDHDTIIPNYPCGFKDKTVQVSYHGATWATWKLTDMAEKHADKCKNCKGMEPLVDLSPIFNAMAAQMKKVGIAAEEAADKLAEYMLIMLLGATRDVVPQGIITHEQAMEELGFSLEKAVSA